MLEPQDRRLLLESLRPPSGYSLDHAVATTFSLDLVALLAAPLAFTLFDWDDEDGRPTADPHALLAAVREHADKVTLFCQAGQIAIPPYDQLLYGYLEGSVFEATPPKPKGVFHPKIWLLRYVAPEEPVRYRFLCLSRNLTFDRCWDTMLVLDGELTRRRNAFSANHPLGDFVAALPDLALEDLPDTVESKVLQLAHEVRRVAFDLPEGFEKARYWPLGIVGHERWPFRGRVDRLLAISPFISPPALGRFASQGKGHLLVSRLESLAPLATEDLAGYEVSTLSDSANAQQPDATASAARAGLETDAPADCPLTGLHAKVYVADAGSKARVWVGSANATEAAFERNVEFLVELEGRKSVCGVDASLEAPEGTVALRDLLNRYQPGEEPEPPDAIAERLEREADDLRRGLATAGLAVHVKLDSGGRFDVELRASTNQPLRMPDYASLRAWPVTQRLGRVVTPGEEPLASYPSLALESLTPFFAFELALAEEGRETEARFVLKLPLHGAPADRHDAILRRLLTNRGDVVRYLIMLLAGASAADLGALAMMGRASSVRAGAPGAPESEDVPLLESLLRALDREPTKLRHVDRLIKDLSRTPEGEALLPEDLARVWPAIADAARKESG